METDTKTKKAKRRLKDETEIWKETEEEIEKEEEKINTLKRHSKILEQKVNSLRTYEKFLDDVVGKNQD